MYQTLKSFSLIFALVAYSGSHAYAFEGFGSGVTGGSGGSVIMVTNLNNTGTGSLRAALTGGLSNRIVQFNGLSGTITLTTPIEISGHNITIDGFTANSPGITLTSHSLYITGNTSGPDTTGSNIIIRGLRIRNLSGDSEGDGIQIAYNAHDIVVDHCSIANAGDGGIDITEGAYNITLSWNFIHTHGAGWLGTLVATNASKVSIHHSLYADGRDRWPYAGATHRQLYSSGPAYDENYALVDYRYNVMMSGGIGTVIASGDENDTVVGKANVVSNYYDFGGDSANTIIRTRWKTTVARARAYVAGNVANHDPRGTMYNYGGVSGGTFTTTTLNDVNSEGTTPFPSPAITGPAFSNTAGMIAEWSQVRAQAGVITYYADDATDSTWRNWATINSNVFSLVWNSDAIPAGSPLTPKSPSSIEVH